MRDLIHRHRQWLSDTQQRTDPHRSWKSVTWSGMHEGGEERYPLHVQHPPDFELPDLLEFPAHSFSERKTDKGLRPMAVLGEDVPLSKAVGPSTRQRTANSPAPPSSRKTECDGGRWITVHPHGDDMPGQALYLCPNKDGSHTVVGGAGGKLNGLRMLNVKSPEEYAAHAKEQQRQKRQKAAADQNARRAQLGQAEFARQEGEKKAAISQKREARIAREKEAISAFLTAQGLDPAQVEVPAEKLKGLDKDAAAQLQEKHHRALMTWARQVGGGVREVLRDSINEVGSEALGEVGTGAILDALADKVGGGSGYSSPVKALALERGLSEPERAEAVEGMKMSSLAARVDNNLAEAQARRAAGEKLQAGQAERRERIAAAAHALGEEGIGPDAIQKLSKVPALASADSAVQLLAALKRVDAARKDELETRRTLTSTDDILSLPRAAFVAQQPLSDDEARKQVAADLDEDRRRASMIALVGAANDIEDDSPSGALQRHRSVGQGAAFNAITAAVDGSTIDPIVHDLLGAQGAAQVLAARWRASLPEEKVGELAQMLGEHHIRGQEKIADDATAEAHEYMAHAEEIQKGLSELPQAASGEDLEARLLAHREAHDYISRARQSLGIAQGRLEAAAALNEAFQQPATATVHVALGNTGLERGMDIALALGLDSPSKYSPEDGVLQERGEFELTQPDGKNTFLTIHPDGVAKLAGKVDPELTARVARSRAIKAGLEDEADWLPEGIARRPTSTFEVDPLQVKRHDERLGLDEADDEAAMGEKIKSFIGSMMARGRTPEQVESLLRSGEMAASLGLSDEGVGRFQRTMAGLSEQWLPDPTVNMKDPAAAQAELERYKGWQKGREATYKGYLDNYLSGENLPEEEKALHAQTVPLSRETADCLYTALLSDPGTRHAFTPLGDLTPEDRADIRRWASGKMFGLNEGQKDEPLEALSPEQRRAHEEWNKLKDTGGDPHGAIQAAWRKQAEDEPEDMFGEKPEAHPLATVDLSDDVSVLSAAKRVPGMLGYEPMIGTDGKKTYPELEASDTRPQNLVASEAKRRIRGALRQHFIGNILGLTDLAASGWSPTSVQTSPSDRWADYARHMGEADAYGAAQELMRGDVVHKFASEYSARTGQQLAVGSAPLSKAQRHAEAMLSPEQREKLDGMDASARAKFIRREGGKFAVTGSVKDQGEADRAREAETPTLFADAGATNTNVERPTVGRAVEAMLGSIAPGLNVSKQTEAAAGLNLSEGEGLYTQRAIKLIEANKKQGVNLGTGLGKTLCGFGAFTHLRAKGKATRGLFVVPSNVVGQFPAEMDKFRDPSVPLFKACSEGMSGAQRRAALANQNLHAFVTTPEALREDVVHALSQHLGVGPDEAAQRVMGETDAGKRDAMIHSALDHAGYHFDYGMLDEAHRLLGRQGKPDALMAHIARAVGNRADHLVYATADPIKNDTSEAHSILSMLDPARHPEGNRDSFVRKFGRGGRLGLRAQSLALQRTMEPYIYAENASLGIKTESEMPHEGAMKLTEPQQAAHDAVLDAYGRARKAARLGKYDFAALEQLAPKQFEGLSSTEERTRVAEKLSKSLATLRDSALARVIDAFPGGVKENWVSEDAEKHRGKPVIYFARLLDSVDGLANRLRSEGHKVATITGAMSDKSRPRQAFMGGEGKDPEANILICSDAAAMGGNYQRGIRQVNIDVPATAMIHAQRLGRIRRRGQKAAQVSRADLVTDTDFDRRARARLETKAELREVMTTPSASIDDSGLAYAIEQSGIHELLSKKAE